MTTSTSNTQTITWAEQFLIKQGLTLKNNTVLIQHNPWSSLYRIDTSIGPIYLKQAPFPFNIEANLLIHLGCKFPDKVPEVIGHNDELGCFLLFDAGAPLRQTLQSGYQVLLAQQVLNQYSTMQQEMATDTETLLDLGVPDWRLARIPVLYHHLLHDEDLLKKEGLTLNELKKLRQKESQIAERCHQLMHYEIPETIDQGDFHDNNVLINAQYDIVISDWAESVITHPFFSILSFLSSTERVHGISPSNEIYQSLLNSHLKAWLHYESQADLLEAFALIKPLSAIKYALSLHRLSALPQWQTSAHHQGKIGAALKCLLSI